MISILELLFLKRKIYFTTQLIRTRQRLVAIDLGYRLYSTIFAIRILQRKLMYVEYTFARPTTAGLQSYSIIMVYCFFFTNFLRYGMVNKLVNRTTNATSMQYEQTFIQIIRIQYLRVILNSSETDS